MRIKMMDEIIRHDSKYGSFKFKNPIIARNMNDAKLDKFSSLTHAKFEFNKDPTKFTTENDIH